MSKKIEDQVPYPEYFPKPDEFIDCGGDEKNRVRQCTNTLGIIASFVGPEEAPRWLALNESKQSDLKRIDDFLSAITKRLNVGLNLLIKVSAGKPEMMAAIKHLHGTLMLLSVEGGGTVMCAIDEVSQKQALRRTTRIGVGLLKVKIAERRNDMKVDRPELGWREDLAHRLGLSAYRYLKPKLAEINITEEWIAAQLLREM